MCAARAIAFSPDAEFRTAAACFEVSEQTGGGAMEIIVGGSDAGCGHI